MSVTLSCDGMELRCTDRWMASNSESIRSPKADAPAAALPMDVKNDRRPSRRSTAGFIAPPLDPAPGHARRRLATPAAADWFGGARIYVLGAVPQSILVIMSAMRLRTFGRLAWRVSEVGYGMWGMAGWTGSDDAESRQALDRAVELGCNFFDTAYAYGNGRSERLLRDTLARHRGTRLYAATKVPPRNGRWPGRAETPVDDVFPYDYIVRM